MAVSVNVFDAKNVEVKQLSTKTVTVSFDDGNLNSVTLFISPDDLSAFANKLLVATTEMLEVATADEPAE